MQYEMLLHHHSCPASGCQGQLGPPTTECESNTGCQTPWPPGRVATDLQPCQHRRTERNPHKHISWNLTFPHSSKYAFGEGEGLWAWGEEWHCTCWAEGTLWVLNLHVTANVYACMTCELCSYESDVHVCVDMPVPVCVRAWLIIWLTLCVGGACSLASETNWLTVWATEPHSIATSPSVTLYTKYV